MNHPFPVIKLNKNYYLLVNVKKIFSVVFIILNINENFAQSSFKNGFILKTSTDTLFGKIEIRSENYMAKKCKFINTSDNKTSIYYPEDIHGYFVENSNYYISKEIENEKVFLQVLVKGKLNVFYKSSKTGDHYYIQKDSSLIKELPYKEGIIRDDYKTYNFKSTDHVKILKNLTEDAPLLQNEINQLKAPTHENISNIATKYHYEVCKDSLCITYVRNKVKSKPIITIQAGIVSYNPDFDYLDPITSSVIGFLIDKPLNIVNPNISIRTGISFEQVENSYEEKQIIKIPVIVVYNMYFNKLNPNIGYGTVFTKNLNTEIYLKSGLSFLITAGLSKKVSNRIGVTLNYDFEYLPKKLLPIFDSVLAHSLKIGGKFHF